MPGAGQLGSRGAEDDTFAGAASVEDKSEPVMDLTAPPGHDEEGGESEIAEEDKEIEEVGDVSPARDVD